MMPGVVASNYSVLPAPLLAYNFSESGTAVTDRTGNGRNASLVVGATPTDLHSSGQLLIAQSGRRLVYTPDAAALPSFLSVTMKITTTSNTPGFNEQNFWSKFRAADSSGFNLYMEGGKLNCVARGTTIAGPSIITTGGPTLNASTTYQIGATYDGTTLRLYLDGAASTTAATATGPLDMTGADTTWSIGDAPSDSAVIPTVANFLYDDVRFWNVALTAAQMAAAATTPVS